MFTDTHCHITKNEYDDYERIINDLKVNNIKRIIINGYNLDSNKEVIKLINKYDNVYGAIGIHPNYIEEVSSELIEFIEDNINHPKVIAIGEIGLDYYRNKDLKQQQLEMFNKILTIASKNNKAVIIHNRDATSDIISNLKKHNVNGIIHCFSGSVETANEYIKLGFKLGINGILTFKNSNLGNTISKVDIKNILLETDAPYLSPEPVRATKNEPKNIIYIAEKLAEIYDVSLHNLSKKLEENFHDTFDI